MTSQWHGSWDMGGPHFRGTFTAYPVHEALPLQEEQRNWGTGTIPAMSVAVVPHKCKFRPVAHKHHPHGHAYSHSPRPHLQMQSSHAQPVALHVASQQQEQPVINNFGQLVIQAIEMQHERMAHLENRLTAVAAHQNGHDFVQMREEVTALRSETQALRRQLRRTLADDRSALAQSKEGSTLTLVQENERLHMRLQDLRQQTVVDLAEQDELDRENERLHVRNLSEVARLSAELEAAGRTITEIRAHNHTLELALADQKAAAQRLFDDLAAKEESEGKFRREAEEAAEREEHLQEEHENKEKALATEVDRLKKQELSLKQENDEIRRSHQVTAAERDALVLELDNLRRDATELRSKLSTAESRARRVESAKDRLQEELALTHQAVQEARLDLENVHSEVENRRKSEASLQMQLRALSDQVSRLRSESQRHDDAESRALSTAAQLQSELDAQHEASTRLRAQIVEHKKREEIANIERTKLKERIAELEANVQATRPDSHLSRANRRIAELEEQLRRIAINPEIDTLRHEKALADARIQQLERQVQSTRSVSEENNRLTAEVGKLTLRLTEHERSEHLQREALQESSAQLSLARQRIAQFEALAAQNAVSRAAAPSPFGSEDGRSSVASTESARERPTLGLEIKILDDGHGGKDNVIVVHNTHPGGPAATAGLQAGDILLKWDSEALHTKAQFDQRMRNAFPGLPVTFTIMRTGSVLPQTVAVVFGKTTRQQSGPRKVRSTTALDPSLAAIVKTSPPGGV
eukprot:TRINITY_DN81154_c0_g1_i1.p1 TRINITY_DN81154_c0_g1~~TRINITY_DN81154_c0_g1_i1.p1  ORF type:complete len:758 (-),score=128.16 TRINITY_DN81154_c0_g1_i1:103-2376(-)